MSESPILYSMIILLFVVGSIYQFKIRINCVYPIKITRMNMIIIIIAPLIFIFIAYASGNTWYHYLLSLSGAIYIISSIVGQGIHKKGIYCLPFGRRTIFPLVKWEDIKGVSVDSSKNKIHSYRLMSKEILLSHYYKEEDFDEIKKMLDKKIS